MKRLFFALWPDNKSRQQIDHINQQITLSGTRKLIVDNLHITLVFLGNVDDAIAEAVQRRAGDIIASPISLQFDELDYWAKPKVVCLTCHRQPKAVYQLVNALTRMLADYPVRVEQRPYRAHITLARKAKRRPQLNFTPVVINADSFALVESKSSERGVIYEVLECWPLKG